MSKSSSTEFGIGVLAGVIGGIILGVLYAKKPGEETRKELKQAACEFAETNAPKIKKAKEEVINKIDLLKCHFENKCDKLNSKMKAKKMAKAKDKEEKNYEFN